MNFSEVIQNLNWIAILVAALSAFALGSIWYSPLMFFKSWSKAANIVQEDIAGKNMVLVFSTAFVLSFLMAFNLALFIGNESDFSFALIAALLTGIGWVVPAFAIIALFENRSWAYFLVNGGYLLLTFIIMGIILGAWK